MIHLATPQRAFRRRAFRWVLTSVICIFAGLTFGQKPSQTSDGATILIIRHAEKPSSGHKLSALGEERAEKYIGYFKTYSIGQNAVHFDAFFAAKDSKQSHRPRLTIDPLRKSLLKSLNTDFKNENFADLVVELKGADFAGKTVLVCWHHGEIPDMLRAFGANPKVLLPHGQWPDDVFGWLVELHLDRSGSLQSIKIINEKLMADDTTNPPESVH